MKHREIIVDIKNMSLTWPAKKPFIYEWGSGIGFGAFTEEEALAEAKRLLPSRLEASPVGVCIEIAHICPTCKVTGIKPGCKRKKCPTCEGRGTVDRYGFVVLGPKAT